MVSKGSGDSQVYKSKMNNFDLFVHKVSLGIQQNMMEQEPMFMEVNEFVLVERALEDLDETCYIQVALHIMNITRRLVLSFLMRDPFPFKPGTFSSTLKDFMFEFRQLDFKQQSIDSVQNHMAEIEPRKYEDTDEQGDSLDAFYSLCNNLINDEVLIIKLKHT